MAKLQPLLPTRPFQLVTCDIIGPLPLTKNGNIYILVVCDHFSKWVAISALQNITAESVAKRLINLMMIHGLYINILTDGAKNFQSELLSKIYELLDIHKLKTSPYHPECDGLTERFNRTLKTMLSCFVNEHQNDWDEYLQYMAYAYNTSTHATTNHTPFEVVYGRKPKIPLDLIIEDEKNDEIYELDESSQGSIVVKLFVGDLQEKLREVYKNVEKNRDFMVDKSRIQHDRKIKPVEYKIDDMVMLNQPQIKKGLSKKLSPKWEGPFIIQERVGPVNYKIKRFNQPKSEQKLVHHNRLKRFFGPYVKSHEEFNSNKDMVSQSESVLESTEDEDETFQPKHYFQKKISNRQNHLRRSKRSIKPVDRLGY